MSDKKHIDRIFQEKLKDFEVSPNPELWTKIQNELNIEQDQPKKVIPIWLRLASIAAVLAVLITIGSFVFDGESDKDVPVTNTVDTNSINSSQDNSDGLNNKTNSEDINSNIPIDNPETSTANLDDKDTSQDDSTASSINSNTSKTEVLKSDKTSNSKVASNNDRVNPTKNNDGLNSNTETSHSNVTTRTASLSDGNSKASNNKVNSKENAASNSMINTADLKNSESTSNINKTRTTSNSSTPNTTNYIENKVSSNSEVNTTKTAQSESNTELDTDAANRALGKENTQDAIALNAMKGDNPHNEKEKEESLKVGDSLNSESPSIEEAIAQAEELNEKEEEKEKLVNRWQVYANVAPVYYNSLGEGSHIDEQFVSNSKSGETNMSYGINVSYALSKKLALRSGVNSLDLSYDTDNVILYESPSSNSNTNPINPLRNINLAPESQSLNALSGQNLGFQQIISDLSNAAISQRLSYYEVPVELEYKLVNNRFGVNLIGGVSTFFLNNNEVYSEFEEYTTYIGEANNINNISFSTNLGIGMNYSFSEKFRFNLEPTFKYQLNAFNNTSGDFRPYIIGVYTGFSYKF
jgi:hypothetical protein